METKSKTQLLDHTGKPIKLSQESNDEDLFSHQKLYLPTTKSLLGILDTLVYSQRSAKEALALGIQNIGHRFMMPDINLPKSNILMIGPTGTGKTYLVDIVSQISDIPVAKVNMTGLSQEGFQGGSISESFYSLIDKQRTQEQSDYIYYKPLSSFAIVYLDEIDKIANDSLSGGGFSKGLQDELIGYLENKEVFDGLSTKEMLFIGSGAFSGLEEIIKRRVKGQGTVGFTQTSAKKEINDTSIFSYVNQEDLIEYGFKPELAARFTNVCHLDELTTKDLEKINAMPTSYLFKRKELLKRIYNIDLHVTKGANEEIANYAKKQKTNARSLQNTIDKLLKPILLNADSITNSQLRFDKRYVQNYLQNN